MQSLPNPILAMILRMVPFHDAKRLFVIRSIGDMVLDVHFRKFIKSCFLVPRHIREVKQDMSIAVEVRPECECALLRLIHRATRHHNYMTGVLNTIAFLLYNTFEHEIRKYWQILNRCQVTCIRCAVSWPDLLISIEDRIIDVGNMVCERLLCIPKCIENLEQIQYTGVIERVLPIHRYLYQLQVREEGYETVKKYIK